jgi:hypothetical protein
MMFNLDEEHSLEDLLPVHQDFLEANTPIGAY